MRPPCRKSIFGAPFYLRPGLCHLYAATCGKASPISCPTAEQKRERKKRKKKLALLLQRPRRVLEDVGRLNFNGSRRNERLTRRKKLVESAALFVVEVQKKKFLELVQK